MAVETPIPSYPGKEFIIDDNQAYLRNPKNLSHWSRYKEGDKIPPDKSIKDIKLLKLGTKVKVTDVRVDKDRNVYVFAEPIDAPDFTPSGWTKATNLEGKFINERIGYLPSEWELKPCGDNYTVTDSNALVRKGPPTFEFTGEKGNRERIPVGTYVDVTGRSRQTVPEGQYVRVCKATIENGELVKGEPIGWTASSNLVQGNSKAFTSPEWANTKGPNAAWKRVSSKKGAFIGAKVLISIVGTGGQLQHIALETLQPYLDLMEAAKKDHVALSINSGFRTFQKQETLYNWYLADKKNHNLAAKPGTSNHQNGVAFDLNTGGFDTAKYPVYRWMKKNATTYGFFRTVSREHWHWEYHPVEAAELKKAKTFKRSYVKP